MTQKTLEQRKQQLEHRRAKLIEYRGYIEAPEHWRQAWQSLQRAEAKYLRDCEHVQRGQK